MNQTCEEARELLDAYALGALEAEETAFIEAHVEDCLSCRSALTDARQAASLLALSVPIRRSSSALRQRVMEQVEREAHAKGVRNRIPSLGMRLLPLAAAVFLAIAVGVSVWAVVLQTQLGDLREENRYLVALQEGGLLVMTAPDRQSYPMTGTGRAASATANYYWSRTYNTGVLVANNVPNPPSGMAYQFWVYEGERAINAGIFKPHNGALTYVTDTQGVSTPSAFVLTLEPDEGSPQPTGEIILTSRLVH